MKTEQKTSKVQPENYRNPAEDRLAWVSKYLDLADKIMGNRNPEKRKEGDKR